MAKKRAAPAAPVAKTQEKAVAASHTGKASLTRASAKRTTAPAEKTPSRKTNKAGALKVIRDSFTMPLTDYELIGALKSKCLAMGIAAKKSELLRAGLHALGRISDENLAQVVRAVESIKTGRPPGKKKKKKTSRTKDRK